MTPKSWHLNRRELLRGGGVALGLPFLNGMCWGAGVNKATPKRMLVSYFAYGAYMPHGTGGIPKKEEHHDWSWWPTNKPGKLTFNKNSAPFVPFASDVSYLCGLDHKGGWKMSLSWRAPLPPRPTPTTNLRPYGGWVR